MGILNNHSGLVLELEEKQFPFFHLDKIIE